MTKKNIVKEIQHRINSAMINGKEDVALALRELMDVILSSRTISSVEDLYYESCKRNAELMAKIQQMKL